MDVSDIIQVLLKQNRELQKTLMETELEIFDVRKEIHTILDIVIELEQISNSSVESINFINNSDLVSFFCHS
jgi:hypothetical protein